MDGKFQPGQEWRLEVTDERRNPLYVIRICRRDLRPPQLAASFILSMSATSPVGAFRTLRSAMSVRPGSGDQIPCRQHRAVYCEREQHGFLGYCECHLAAFQWGFVDGGGGNLSADGLGWNGVIGNGRLPCNSSKASCRIALCSASIFTHPCGA
jgi:hypothetical protein